MTQGKNFSLSFDFFPLLHHLIFDSYILILTFLRTRDALQKSVQLAIEITTQSQEATARHEAARSEQEAKGELERQKIKDEAKAEEARKALLELQAASAAVEAMGAASAEARAQAARAEIQGIFIRSTMHLFQSLFFFSCSNPF